MAGARLLALCVALLVLAASPVAAGTREDPEISDPCGVGTHLADQPAVPWHDLCAVWFETLSEDDEDAVPVIRVTMAFAGDVNPRTDSHYAVTWRAGHCGMRVERNDTGGDNLGLDRSPTVELRAQCERGRQVDCDPPILDDLGFVCASIPPPVVVDVSDGYAEDGDEISWTLAFEDDLAAWAALHRHGRVLADPTAEASPVVGGSRLLIASCGRTNDDPWECRSVGGNWALNSRDYVVGS